MPSDLPVDYNDFVSKVASHCILFVEPIQISEVMKLLVKKTNGFDRNSWMWDMYHRQALTPSETATEIVNELIAELVR